jgi:hypothetical protein
MKIISRTTCLKVSAAGAAVASAAILGAVHPAYAAATSSVPAAAADCQTTSNHGADTEVSVDTCDGHAYSISAYLFDSTDGYFVFHYVLNGKNTVIGTPTAGKVWATGEVASRVINAVAAPPGSRWCSDFWEYTSPGNAPVLLDSNCIQF